MTKTEEIGHTDWKATEVNILEGGKLIEIHFKSTKCFSTHKATLLADVWLRGMWAEMKLAELQESLKEAFNILQGRR